MNELNELIANDQLIASLWGAVNRSSGNLMNVGPLLERVIETGAWRKRENVQLGEVVEFGSFKEFLETPPLRGCGWTIEKIEALLKFEPPILELFRGALRADEAIKADAEDRANASRQGQRTGLDRTDTTDESWSDFVDIKKSDINEVKQRPTGTSASAALRRLRKERPNIHERVLAGEITPNAGMVEAGFRKKLPSRKRGPLQKILSLLPLLTHNERAELKQKLDEH